MQKRYNKNDKKNLLAKREYLRHRLKESEFSVDEIGTVFSSEYPRFLEYAAELDAALKLEQWENADEIADTLIDLPPFKDNLRYIAIVYRLLEDFNA